MSTLHEEFRGAINDGDNRLRDQVAVGDARLREHIDQQIAQIKDAHCVSEAQVQLALNAAEKLELERVERVEARINDGVATLVHRLEEGDARTNEHVANLKEAMSAAIAAQRLAVTIAQEANVKAIDKALASVDQRFSELQAASRERMNAMQREVGTAQRVAGEAVDKAELAARLRMDEGDTRLREHIGAQYGQISAALEAARRETSFAHAASEKAIAKAEVANEKRFESVNEFRSQLSDQATTFLPREVAESFFNQLSERVRSIEGHQLTAAGASDQQRRTSDRTQPWVIWVAGALISAAAILANHL